MKKLVILTFSVTFFALNVFVVYAQTFEGPPAGCYSPTQSGCNVPGVIWNKDPKAGGATAQDAGFYITGDARTTGDMRIGNGLRVDSNGANISGNIDASGNITAIGDSRAGNGLIQMWSNGDLWMSDTKSIRIDQAGASTLNIGNWIPGNNPVNVNIFGTLSVLGNGTWNNPQISTPWLCLNGDCRDKWPVAGGGGTGDVTDVLQGSGILVTNSAGPQPSVALNWTDTDNRYVNYDGDTMANSLTLSGGSVMVNNGAVVATIPNANIGAVRGTGSHASEGLGGVFSGSLLGVKGISTGSPFAGQYGVWGVAQGANGTAGYFRNNTVGTYAMLGDPSGSLITNGTNRLGGVTWLTNTQISDGGQICFNTGGVASCKVEWPDADISSVIAGTGLTGGAWSGDVVLNIANSYALPQLCGNGQIAKWNGANWTCANDFSNAGDVTDVLSGTGISVSNSVGPQPTVNLSTTYRLPQSCANGNVPIWNSDSAIWSCGVVGFGLSSNAVSIFLDTAYTDSRYINASSDNVDLVVPNNLFGTGGTNYSVAPCYYQTASFDAGATVRRGCFDGDFMAGVEYNDDVYGKIVGIWCCPL